VPTGVAIALPDGYVGLVHPRSGLAARHGLSIVNTPGTVDAGYRGEIKVLLINLDPREPIELRAATGSPSWSSSASSGRVSSRSTLPETVRGDGRPRFYRRLRRTPTPSPTASQEHLVKFRRKKNESPPDLLPRRPTPPRRRPRPDRPRDIATGRPRRTASSASTSAGCCSLPSRASSCACRSTRHRRGPVGDLRRRGRRARAPGLRRPPRRRCGTRSARRSPPTPRKGGTATERPARSAPSWSASVPAHARRHARRQESRIIGVDGDPLVRARHLDRPPAVDDAARGRTTSAGLVVVRRGAGAMARATRCR
jgi:hypothetical protein